MNTTARWEQSRGSTSFRLFEDNFTRDRSGHADLATWALPVDIYETENELVVKADLPDLQEKGIDVHVTNNTLTIRGERKFVKDINDDNYLRIERAYGLHAKLLPTEHGHSREHSGGVSQWGLDPAYG